LLSWSGKVYLELMIVQGIGIEHANSLVGFALGTHRDEAKSLGFASSAIHDNIHRSDISGLCEQSIQLLLSCILGQIPYIDLDFHSDCFLRISG